MVAQWQRWVSAWTEPQWCVPVILMSSFMIAVPSQEGIRSEFGPYDESCGTNSANVSPVKQADLKRARHEGDIADIEEAQFDIGFDEAPEYQDDDFDDDLEPVTNATVSGLTGRVGQACPLFCMLTSGLPETGF